MLKVAQEFAEFIQYLTDNIREPIGTETLSRFAHLMGVVLDALRSAGVQD